MIKNSNFSNEEEIDLIFLFKKIYLKKNQIFKITLSFFIIGLFVSLLIPVKYRTQLSFTLNTNDNNQSSRISNIASSITGIDLGVNNNTQLQPHHYVYLFNDNLFRKDLLSIKLNENLSLMDYIYDMEISIFEYILSLPKNLYNYIISIFLKPEISVNFNNKLSEIDSIYYINDSDLYSLKILNDLVGLSINNREMVFNIYSLVDNPYYSFILTKMSYELLQKRIIKIANKSSSDIYQYNLRNFNEKKVEFLKIQNKLSKFKDENQIISTSRFNDRLSRIQNEFNLIYSVYEELAKQVELSKIELKKDTPVFTILENPIIPKNKFSPQRGVIVFSFVFLGLFISIIFVLTKDIISNFFYSVFK